MNVSPLIPFQIVYSIFQHEYLGYLFETYAIQLDPKGKLSLKHQHISLKNAKEFSEGMDEKDFDLIKLIDALSQEVITHKFSGKRTLKPEEYFLKIYSKTKGDEIVQGAIESYIEAKKAEILDLLVDKPVFEMGSDGEPTWKPITVAEEKASVLFHFRRNETNTHYFPTIKYKGEKLDFTYKSAILLCYHPAWLLLGNKIYNFEKDVDGKKLKPFLNKKFIEIPRKLEESYYEKFVAPLVAAFDVYAKGFEINTEKHEPQPVLTFSELQTNRKPMALFSNGAVEEEEQEEGKLVFDLSFKYNEFNFSADNISSCSVKMEKTIDSYIFHRVKRQMDWEKEIIALLKSLGMDLKNGRYVLEKSKSFSFIKKNEAFLLNQGFIIRQHPKDEKRYFVGSSSINLEIKESNDWFDIHATVLFGEYEIPFIQLRKYIQRKVHEFELPNGEIAVIPEAWFTQYSELFAFMENDEKQIRLKKHHLALVQELQEDNLAKVMINRKLEKLRSFSEIDDYPMPISFKGELRPYQKAGYNWMRFLSDFKLGGCLADDMGLGKTVQTLAMLLSQKEQGATSASLLVVPTSLIYNWELEAKKFAPALKVFNYTGTYRDKNIQQFEKYDLILTSYGTVRVDSELLQKYYFNYLILDESQAIKNPSSNISQEIVKLYSKYKLILSGTPIENSTLDLWSQMNFVNPGLLGTQSFFRNEFLTPIEKKHDEDKSKKLYSLIKPFILRRQKSQVATELPDKIEQIRYCEMTEAQEKEYEEAKSFYRNKIMDHIEEKGIATSQILLLQGLTKLRQIANHPKMTIDGYEADSGKFTEMIEMLENAIENDHKILIFSQFVKHLTLVKEALDSKKLAYTYLDGATKNRQGQVEEFQQNDTIKIFLISLKAGGVGLNLTAADYVFLLDPWWNPAAENQAIDRAYRIGQKNNVFVYKFISKNTVEEKILQLQKHKLRIANDLISNEESFVKNLSKEDIENLFA